MYRQSAEQYGSALERLARAYEADQDKRLDLLQEIHIALWQSFEGFREQCSLRTWVYRVAHNRATTHMIQQSRAARKFVSVEDIEAAPDEPHEEEAANRRQALDRLLVLIHKLKPLDRQIMLSYLEGLDASSIAQITGISPGNVSVKVHRIKNILARRFHQGGRHGE